MESEYSNYKLIIVGNAYCPVHFWVFYFVCLFVLFYWYKIVFEFIKIKYSQV